MMKRAVLSLSGGMDSTSLLLRLVAEGYHVTAVSFDYGQKHQVELQRASKAVIILNETMDSGIEVEHHIVDISSLGPLLESNLVQGGEDVPEGHYENENMKLTVVPNRNKIFSSIIQAVALSIANKEDCDVKIAMGIHAGDHAVYPDCRQGFRDADYKAFRLGNWNSAAVEYYTPYLDIDKYGILLDAENSCKAIGVIFNTILGSTMTSYKPVYDPVSGIVYSDFKSASSVERIEAFIKLDRVDPLTYAEIVDGAVKLVPWDEVVERVSKVLQKGE